MNVNLHYLNILIVIVLVILLAIQFDWGLIGYFFCLTWRKKTVKFYSVIMTNWFWVEAVAVKRNLCHWTFLQVKIKITHISSSSEADSESDPHWQSILKKVRLTYSSSSTACKSLQTDSSKCNVDIEKLTSWNIYTGRSAAISATFHHRLVSTQTIITCPQLSQSTTKSVQTLISGTIGTNTFGIVTSELVSFITTSDNSSPKNTQTLITGSCWVRSDSFNFNF